MTLALVIANVFVFFVLQAGDDRARAVALDQYVETGLGDEEFPVYREWLATHERGELNAVFDELAGSAPQHAAMLLQSDAPFLAALESGAIVPDSSEGRDDWRARRTAFDMQWQRIFTERWLLRFDRLEVPRLVSATFLHGGTGHLLGNMIFLAVLGLLVEGALGSWRFLVLYLLGGIGASLASLAWNWGTAGGALGASGAIAALMGAYCMLWGTRRVRFFWWFFVVFDYVRAPAIVLLPFWLGWELLNLAFYRGAGIGFEAHAGGIASGALLALGMRALGWERRDFMDEDVRADEARLDALDMARAREHLGRLEIVQARSLLEPMLSRRAQDPDLLVMLYRCARCEAGRPRLHVAALAVFGIDARGAEAIAAQRKVYEDYAGLCTDPRRIPAALRLGLARRWLQHDDVADALRLLQGIDLQAANGERFAGEVLGLVQMAYARGERDSLRPVLETLVGRAPESTEAGKARVLLTECMLG